MAADQAQIVDRAIDWHLRQAEMDDADWCAFVAWLEADPAHALAFDRVALDLAALGEHADLYPEAALYPEVAASVEHAPDRARARRVRAWVGAGLGGGVAIAAAASLTLMIAPAPGDKAAPYTIETKPGQRQSIALEDGTRIDLNGASRLRLDHADPRIATLDSGEATFHVRHDPRDPFTVHSGAFAVQDLGTVFNAERDGKRLDVQVAEGSVSFQPHDQVGTLRTGGAGTLRTGGLSTLRAGGAGTLRTAGAVTLRTAGAVTLHAGGAVTVREDLGSVAVTRIDIAKVGAWRQGAVSFTGEPFGRVATAIERIDGASLAIDSSLSQRPFTGMVRLSGDAARDVPHLAALIGADWHHDGERWFISPR